MVPPPHGGEDTKLQGRVRGEGQPGLGVDAEHERKIMGEAVGGVTTRGCGGEEDLGGARRDELRRRCERGRAAAMA